MMFPTRFVLSAHWESCNKGALWYMKCEKVVLVMQ